MAVEWGSPQWYIDELVALAGTITGRGVGVCNGSAETIRRLESLLLDARTELAAKDDAYRLQFEACASMNGKLERAEALAASNQAKIDALMLEYCPDEMTQAQREEWLRHQKPASDAAIDAAGGRGE